MLVDFKLYEEERCGIVSSALIFPPFLFLGQYVKLPLFPNDPMYVYSPSLLPTFLSLYVTILSITSILYCIAERRECGCSCPTE